MIKFGSENNNDMIFVLDINDNNDNILKITVALSEISEQLSSADNEINPVLQNILEKSQELRPDLNNVYEITFDRYIIYQTRNESFCSWDNYEIRRGNAFIIFERSRFLDYLCSVTDCCQLADGEYYPEK